MINTDDYWVNNPLITPINKALMYDNAIWMAVEDERERIITNINSRVLDLRACTKNDNCQELAMLIESYIPEWTDTE